MQTKIDKDELETMRAGFRKILSLSSSAGHTITNRDALDVIRDIAGKQVALEAGGAFGGALRRHVARVREILAAHHAGADGEAAPRG